jgi:hypothetical protein
MLRTSHSSGEKGWAWSTTFRTRSGRPRSRIGCTAPKPITSTVMNSADRVIDRRHSALATRRMAEMRVPAWEIPMKKTKQMM